MKPGEVWVWGQGGSGQLGTKSNKIEDLPTPAKSQLTFIGIAAGRNYSLCISDDLRYCVKLKLHDSNYNYDYICLYAMNIMILLL